VGRLSARPAIPRSGRRTRKLPTQAKPSKPWRRNIHLIIKLILYDDGGHIAVKKAPRLNLKNIPHRFDSPCQRQKK
jgi:hypothetical protein